MAQALTMLAENYSRLFAVDAMRIDELIEQKPMFTAMRVLSLSRGQPPALAKSRSVTE